MSGAELRVLAIVPARRGSKRVPGKNARALGGRPLVGWVLDAASAAKTLTRIVVSSNDPIVLDLARSYGVAVLARPEEISTDDAPAHAYVVHALDCLRSQSEGEFDAVAILQPSSPFTTADDIDGVVGLLERTAADSAVSVVQVEHAVHPLKLKRLVGDRLEPYLEEERGRMAASDMPEVYVRNGSVYASRRATIERGSILGDDSRGFVMPRERSLDINDETDFAFAEFLLGRRSHTGLPSGSR